jgi:hypothetical protein
MTPLIFNPIAGLVFFLFVILPIILFWAHGVEIGNSGKLGNRENKYHNLSKEEREELSK